VSSRKSKLDRIQDAIDSNPKAVFERQFDELWAKLEPQCRDIAGYGGGNIRHRDSRAVADTNNQ
jgi:hypothetical protein